jgi:glycosyltransferase involved in cell wall biosynthesis
MDNWPALSVLVVTYNRKNILAEVLRALREHVYYVGPIFWVVADDGSDDGTVEMLKERFPDTLLVQSNRVGLGANANAGLREAAYRSPIILQLQDDMKLLTTLDLHPHVQKLIDDETCGYIRLWGVGGHRYTANLEGNHWRIHWNSEELYIPSDRPHLKHRRFHEFFGMYPEGHKTADTEDAWAHQCKDRAGLNGVQLDVFVPQMETEKSWEHIGWHDRWRDKNL